MCQAPITSSWAALAPGLGTEKHTPSKNKISYRKLVLGRGWGAEVRDATENAIEDSLV